MRPTSWRLPILAIPTMMAPKTIGASNILISLMKPSANSLTVVPKSGKKVADQAPKDDPDKYLYIKFAEPRFHGMRIWPADASFAPVPNCSTSQSRSGCSRRLNVAIAPPTICRAASVAIDLWDVRCATVLRDLGRQKLWSSLGRIRKTAALVSNVRTWRPAGGQTSF